MEEIKLFLSGDLLAGAQQLISSATVMGFLQQQISKTDVNIVSALSVAKKRGLKLYTVLQDDPIGGYPNQIEVKVQ